MLFYVIKPLYFSTTSLASLFPVLLTPVNFFVVLQMCDGIDFVITEIPQDRRPRTAPSSALGIFVFVNNIHISPETASEAPSFPHEVLLAFSNPSTWIVDSPELRNLTRGVMQPT